MIDTFESKYGRVAASGHALERFVVRFWQAPKPIPMDLIRTGQTDGGVVEALVNQGRWIVECPTLGCNEASLVFDSDPRFVCVSCGVGPLLVVMPAEREGIEAALEERPEANRNWLPRESVGDLRKENDHHMGGHDKPGRPDDKPERGKK